MIKELNLREGKKNLIVATMAIGLLALFLHSCRKDKDEIPDVYVDIYISSTDPQFTWLNPVGGWAYVTGGSRGIVVYHKTADVFMAYERHCPYRPSNVCAKISVDSTNVTAVDTCCGSKFMLYDGSVSNGPAAEPLKQYKTSFDGNILHIVN